MTRYAAARLTEARAAAGLSLTQAAALAATSANTLALLEKGTVLPEPKLLDRLAEVCGVESLYDADDPADPVTRFDAEMTELARQAPRFSDARRSELRDLLYG